MSITLKYRIPIAFGVLALSTLLTAPSPPGATVCNSPPPGVKRIEHLAQATAAACVAAKAAEIPKLDSRYFTWENIRIHTELGSLFIHEEIAGGVNGMIFDAELDGKPVAVKVNSWPKMGKDEAEISRLFSNSPHLIQSFGSVDFRTERMGPNETNNLIILQKADHTLREDLEELRPIDMRKRQIGDILMGLQSMHRQGYRHGDLHDGNFLVLSNGDVVLADFGLARKAELSELTQENKVMAGKLIELFEDITDDATRCLLHRFEDTGNLVTALSELRH